MIRILEQLPASEQRISEVERGSTATRSFRCRAGKRSAQRIPSSSLLFLHIRVKRCFVQDGDLVCVSLTQVTELGGTDPATDQPFSDSPGNHPARAIPLARLPDRHVKSRGSHGKA